MKRILASLGLVLCLNVGLAEDDTKNTRIVCNDEKIERLFTKGKYIYKSQGSIICKYAESKEVSAKCYYDHLATKPFVFLRTVGVGRDFEDEFFYIYEAIEDEIIPIVEKHYSAFLKKKFEEGKCKEIKLGD